MARLIVGILIWLIVLPVTAQEQVRWDSGCDPMAQEVIAPIMGEDLYNAGCAARELCFDEIEDPPIGCEFPVYDALVSLCEGEDCDLQSRFYMASLLIFEQPPHSLYLYAYDPSGVQATVADTLVAFQTGDYQAVIDIYEDVSAYYATNPLPSPFLDFIVGLLLEETGDLEAAADAYRLSISSLRMPFVTAQRAQVLIQLGYEDVAAAEALTMRDYPAAEAILAEHPLPETALTDWIGYPVERNYIGQWGPDSWDYSLLPGVPFQLAFLSDGSVLMLGTTETILPFTSRILPDAVLFYPGGMNADWAGVFAGLSVEADGGRLFDHGEDVNGYVEFDVLVAPADAPDPRVGEIERCENGARWRLMVDGYGAADRVYTEAAPFYYDAPGGESVGTFSQNPQPFRVVAGPECVAGQAWWEINLLQDDGQTYWLPEADAPTSDQHLAILYFVRPTSPPSN